MAGMTPAVSTGRLRCRRLEHDVDGRQPAGARFSGADSRTLIDGMVVDSMFGNGQCSCVYDNEAQTQEMAVQVSGGSAENQLSGVLVNRIPKYGGNNFSGDNLVLFSNSEMQGQNVDDDLRARGITAPARLAYQYDINYSLGGPILRDKLWFFASGRHWAYNNYVASVFNADGSQAINDNTLRAFPIRLTWQASQRNRLTGLIDFAKKIAGHFQLTSAVSRGHGPSRRARREDRAAEMDVDAHDSSAFRGRPQPDDARCEICLSAGSDRWYVPCGVQSLSAGNRLRQHSASRHPARQDHRGRLAATTGPGPGRMSGRRCRR